MLTSTNRVFALAESTYDSKGTPNLREPDTTLAATIGQQLMKNPGHKGGKDKSSSESGSGRINKAYVEKKLKLTGKTVAAISTPAMQQMRQERSYRI